MDVNIAKKLSINGVYKEYNTRRPFNNRCGSQTIKALNGISLELTPGLYGLLGPNGAGKSTLIGIITGYLKPSAGTVYWNNEDTHKLGIAYRRILGYMPQQQNLYNNYSGRRFLAYMCALKEIPKHETTQVIEACAEKVNLTNHLNKKLHAYSGGMKQRLLAAAALIGEPCLLILDEPSAGLDPKERVRLRTLISEYAKNHIVILATHVVSDVESVAKEIILLKNGKVIDKDSPGSLCAKYAPGAGVEEVYLSVFGQ